MSNHPTREPKPELVARLERELWKMKWARRTYGEIAEYVSPDTLLARDVVIATHPDLYLHGFRQKVKEGAADGERLMRVALEAIKAAEERLFSDEGPRE